LKAISGLEKIEPQGFEDNFWSLGTENSPGGPTVEFYVDNVEIWNLVFNEYILKNGLYIYDVKQDLKFTKDIICGHIEKIFKELNMKYPLKDSSVIMTGGGSDIMYPVFKSRIPHLRLHDNYLLANALGFRKIGETLWQRF
jgi:plasmid segregation protein ParM